LRKSHWHWRFTGAETDKVALVELSASEPCPGVFIEAFYIGFGDIVCFGNLCTGIIALDDVFEAISVLGWYWGDSCRHTE
jgi:hypothetical protein